MAANLIVRACGHVCSGVKHGAILWVARNCCRCSQQVEGRPVEENWCDTCHAHNVLTEVRGPLRTARPIHRP
jgi:hypothetical protein